jgi:adenosine deaminase
MCLTSNVQTGAVPRFSRHPFRRYLEAGLRVTLNTDNRLVSSTTMTLELERAVTTFKLTPGDIRHVLINGFKSAFLPFREKGALLARSLKEMDRAFARAHSAGADSGRDLL